MKSARPKVLRNLILSCATNRLPCLDELFSGIPAGERRNQLGEYIVLEDSRCATSLVLHFTSPDSRYGALRTVAIETLIREFH